MGLENYFYSEKAAARLGDSVQVEEFVRLIRTGAPAPVVAAEPVPQPVVFARVTQVSQAPTPGRSQTVTVDGANGKITMILPEQGDAIIKSEGRGSISINRRTIESQLNGTAPDQAQLGTLATNIARALRLNTSIPEARRL
jgi:hypothetical protein